MKCNEIEGNYKTLIPLTPHQGYKLVAIYCKSAIYKVNTEGRDCALGITQKLRDLKIAPTNSISIQQDLH